MSHMLALITLKLLYNVQIYLPQAHFNELDAVFSNIQALPAERQICNFTNSYRGFRHNLRVKQSNMVMEYIRTKEKQPNLRFPQKDGLYIFPSKYLANEYIFDLFADEEYFTPAPDSMGSGWVVFNQGDDFQEMEKLGLLEGHQIMLYYPGFSFSQTLLIPGFLEELTKTFSFRPKHLQAAEKTIKKVAAKIRRKINIVWVGVHIRRQDFQAYEKSLNLTPLKPRYYIEAMDAYRNFFPHQMAAFLVITDDVAWCKEHVKKADKDVFIVSNPKLELHNGIGHDLAIMSKCNHSIVSRGTFSYFSSFFAGGATILPCHFPAYKLSSDQKNEICNRDPLTNPIPKLYPIQY